MILISFALFYALVHQIRWSGGPLGRALQRWGMRRQLFGSEKLNTRNRALPNNRIVLVFSVLTCITLILCLVGVDYLTPSAPFFSLHYPSNGHINKSFWTSAARFGDMAFALMPLAILFALKAPPFAILATRFFTQLAWDKLIVLHRWSGWLIFSLTTLHVVLWTVQLAKDQYNGRQVFFAVWSSPRFVFGAVAYVAMTALMLLSTRRMRKNHYQVSSCSSFSIENPQVGCLILI